MAQRPNPNPPLGGPDVFAGVRGRGRGTSTLLPGFTGPLWRESTASGVHREPEPEPEEAT